MCTQNAKSFQSNVVYVAYRINYGAKSMTESVFDPTYLLCNGFSLVHPIPRQNAYHVYSDTAKKIILYPQFNEEEYDFT